jgi:hypothetical protein
MTPTTFRPTEEVISSILNMVCPECGGPMGGQAEEFKCQGRCRNDWRMVWEGHLAEEPALGAPAALRLTSIDAHCSRTSNGGRLSFARRASRRHSCQSRVLRPFGQERQRKAS